MHLKDKTKKEAETVCSEDRVRVTDDKDIAEKRNKYFFQYGNEAQQRGKGRIMVNGNEFMDM